MPEARRKARKDSGGSFRRHFLWPLAALVGTLGLALAVSVLWLTAKQDQLQLAAEQQQVRMAVQSRMQAMKRNLGDYAVWDDAVRNLVIRFDHRWATENVAPYLFRVQQYDYVAVIDGHDRLEIASAGASLTNLRPEAVLGQPFAAALRQLRLGPDGADRRLVGLTSVQAKPAIFGLAAIVPSGTAVLPPGPDSFIVVVRVLDAPTLAELGGEFGIEALHLTNRHEPAQLDLVDSGARKVGVLGWVSASPGSNLRGDVVPVILLMVLLMAAVAGAVLRQGRQALINALLARQEAERETLNARNALRDLDDTRKQMAEEGQHFRTTLKETVAAAEEEHDRLIHSTLEERRAEMIRVAEEYQRVIALVRDTLDEAAEALGDVARMPCGEVSATQLLASAGDLQLQARFLEDESRQFLSRLKAA